MTSNKGTKKKVKKSPSNGRRKKNKREKDQDLGEMNISLWRLFHASNKWVQEAADCEYIYKRISSEFNDNLREAIDDTRWKSETLGKQYVAKSVQSHWDTTSYEGLYKADPA